jgi:hypothetical protein
VLSLDESVADTGDESRERLYHVHLDTGERRPCECVTVSNQT